MQRVLIPYCGVCEGRRALGRARHVPCIGANREIKSDTHVSQQRSHKGLGQTQPTL